ncbi:hypothetical protein SAMN03159343_1031 [Klenkia marina]|uniref:Uncharacterized protein n=1 Tax=Klenkia marina TaxID=1960309 RepID=A0A1G4XHR5_9ACTN|nr:hypothetical protein [Klenkia marina]SCX40773.1 hypothetical protein SAMN03159343_1031 [Klenkia marina]
MTEQTRGTAARRTPRRRVLVLAGVVVVALALGGWVLGQRADPRDLVVDYLDAIAAGDVEAANALATDGVFTGTGLPEPGTTDDADLISGVRVGDDGRDTHVSPYSGPDYDALGYEVTYELAGERVSDTVYVERTGGSWLRPEWRIRGSLAQPARLSVLQPLQEVDVVVGSTAITTSAGTTVTEVPLYPGTYRVVPDPEAPVVLDTQEVTVDEDGPFLLLEASPEQLRAGAEADLLAAAAEDLDLCTVLADDDLVCDDGAFASPDGTAGRVTWRVEGDVVLDQEPRSGQTWRTTATVVASWTDPDGSAREQRFDLEGQASVRAVTPDGVQVVAGWTDSTDT